MRGRAGASAGFVLAVVLCSAATAWADFDTPGSSDPSQQFEDSPAPLPYGPNVQRDDTPDDLDYDRAEPGGTSTNLFSERFDLFGFASERTRLTAKYLDPGNPVAKLGKAQISGFNAAGAWKLTRGNPGVAVAVLDTGINWDNQGLRTQVRLNQDELPQPQKADSSTCAYDCNANGVLDVDDYKDDPRVNNSAPTAQDLIQEFENSVDGDGNGFVDDIAGWDFFDNDNDPQDTSSYFAAENHGTGRAEEAVEKGNDALGSIGVCPKCQFVPMRVWDTFVSDQNNFFLAVTYAADNGVKVILGADGGLYHSAFAEKASRYAYEKGVAQIYSGDDLNTGNHNYPGAYNHAMLIQGVSADAEGLGEELPDPGEDDPVGIRDALIGILDGLGVGTTVPVSTYFRNANTTQFGGKSSISMHGPTGSTNTGKAAGAAALVLSAALEKGITLSPDELRALLEQTAEDILPLRHHRRGHPRPRADRLRHALRLRPRERRRGRGRGVRRADPAGGIDRLSRLVRAAAGRRLDRRASQRPRDRLRVEARVRHRPGADQLDHGSDGHVGRRPGHRLRLPADGRHPHRAGESRRPIPTATTPAGRRSTRRPPTPTRASSPCGSPLTPTWPARSPACTARCSPPSTIRRCETASPSALAPAARRRCATPTSTATTSRSWCCPPRTARCTCIAPTAPSCPAGRCRPRSSPRRRTISTRRSSRTSTRRSSRRARPRSPTSPATASPR